MLFKVPHSPKSKDVLDASRNKSIIIRFPDSNGNGATVEYTSSEMALPFPRHSRGFLYYHSEPHAAPLEGSVRFRVTPDGTPLSFSRGHDSLAPWLQMYILFRLDSIFFVNFSTQICFTAVGDAVNPLHIYSLRDSLPNNFKNTFKSPQRGLNTDRLVVHLRIVKIVNPAHVEAKIGVGNIFRDGVPTMVPRIFGYEHHVTEFWQFEDPGLFKSPPATVRRCLGREDPTCSDSILSMGINPAHVRYFGQRTQYFARSSLCTDNGWTRA
ncbi:hypothetical protein C8R44DRAFT_755041 [Mycena epipterygia]|nr:hypothetical protein C8R44DRAFT_755041 [Mycena epipterygia]